MKRKLLDEFVDREAELQNFLDILCDEDCHIMCIWGGGGVGKSSLLARIVHECSLRQLRRAEVVFTDTGRFNYMGLMRKLRDDLGAGYFLTFTDLINYFTVERYEVKLELCGVQSVSVLQDAKLKDTNTGNITGIHIHDLFRVEPRQDMAIPDQERMVRLTDKFLECLNGIASRERVVLFFDSFEKAADETVAWVWDELLTCLRDDRIRNTKVVICGRTRPELSGDWRFAANVVQLEPIGIGALIDYLKLRGVPDQACEDLALMLMTEQGNMLSIAAKVDGYLMFKRAQARRYG